MKMQPTRWSEAAMTTGRAQTLGKTSPFLIHIHLAGQGAVSSCLDRASAKQGWTR